MHCAVWWLICRKFTEVQNIDYICWSLTSNVRLQFQSLNWWTKHITGCDITDRKQPQVWGGGARRGGESGCSSRAPGTRPPEQRSPSWAPPPDWTPHCNTRVMMSLRPRPHCHTWFTHDDRCESLKVSTLKFTHNHTYLIRSKIMELT